MTVDQFLPAGVQMGKKTGGEKRQLARKTHLKNVYVGGALDRTHLLIISG